MRKYFAKVTDGGDHPDYDDSHVEIREKPFPSLTVGEEGIVQLHNMETGDRYKVKMIGLGYYDFEDEEDYRDKVQRVVAEKLDQHGIDHSIEVG